MQNEPTVGEGLSPRQLSAINLLFAGAKNVEICRRLSVARKTLYRWRHSETFAKEIGRRYAQHAAPRVKAQPGAPKKEPHWMKSLRRPMTTQFAAAEKELRERGVP